MNIHILIPTEVMLILMCDACVFEAIMSLVSQCVHLWKRPGDGEVLQLLSLHLARTILLLEFTLLFGSSEFLVHRQP